VAALCVGSGWKLMWSRQFVRIGAAALLFETRGGIMTELHQLRCALIMLGCCRCTLKRIRFMHVPGAIWCVHAMEADRRAQLQNCS